MGDGMGWGGGGKVERGAGEGGRLHAARRAAEQDEVGDAPAPAQRGPPGTARRGIKPPCAPCAGAGANGEHEPGAPAMGQTAAAGKPATPAAALRAGAAHSSAASSRPAPPRSGAGRGRNGEGDGVEPPVEQRSRKARPPSRWRGGQGAPPRWPGSVRHSPARHPAARRRRAPAPQRAAGRGKMIESSRLPLAHRLPLAQSQRDHLAPQIRPAE